MATEYSSSHYNNIFNKKNIEYQLDGINDKLPYVNDDDITLKKNQIIFTSINNVFQKLLDNDLYNEAMIKKNIDAETVGAPTYIPDINNLSNIVELHKKLIISGENGISVVHKEIEDVANTLTGPFLGTIDVPVKTNRIELVNGKFVACAENGLYSSDDKLVWKREIGNISCDVVDVCYNYNYLKNNPISSCSYIAAANLSNGNIAFYGYENASNSWKEFPSNSMLAISNEKANKIFSFKDDSFLYVATKTGGLYGIDISAESAKFETLADTTRLEIRDMADLPHDGNDLYRYLLATSNGLKQSQKAFGFAGLTLQQTIANLFDVLYYNGEYYLASRSGLSYGSSNNSSHQINGLNGIPCYALAVAKDRLFVGTSNGLAIVVNNAIAANALQGNSIIALEILDNNVFAATANAVYCSEAAAVNFSRINAVSVMEGERIVQLKAGNDSLYVLTNKRIIAISTSGSTTVEGFAHFDSFVLNNSNVNFGKQIERNEMLFQKDNRHIVVMNVNNVNNVKLSVEFSREVIDVAKKNDNEYFVLDSSKNVWKLEKELDNWTIVEVNLRANRIEYFNPGDYSSLSSFQGLAFISDDNSLKILLDREADVKVKSLTFNEKYKDLKVHNNNLYGLKDQVNDDTLVLFGKSTANTETLKNILEAEEDLSIITAKKCDNGETNISATLSNVVVDSNLQHQLTITINDSRSISAIDDKIVTDLDFISNVPNVIGTGISSILLAYGNVLSIGHIGANNNFAPKNSKTFDANIVGFADICNVSDKGNIVNAMNLVATEDGNVSSISATESFVYDNISSISQYSTIKDAVSNGPEKTLVVVGATAGDLGSNGIYRYNAVADKTQPNFVSCEGSPSVVFSIASCYNDNVLIASSTGQNAIISSAWNQASEDFTPWTPAYNQNMPEGMFQTNSGIDLSVDKVAIVPAVLSTASLAYDPNFDSSYFAECVNASKIAVKLNGNDFDPIQISSIFEDEIAGDGTIYLGAINGSYYQTRLENNTLTLTEIQSYPVQSIENLISRSSINRAVVGGSNSKLSIGYASDSYPSENIEETIFKTIDLDLNLSNAITLNNVTSFDVILVDNAQFTGTGNKFLCDNLSICFEEDSSNPITADLTFTVAGKFTDVNGNEIDRSFIATSSFELAAGENGFAYNIQEALENDGLQNLYSKEDETITINGHVKLRGLDGNHITLTCKTTGTVSINGFVTKEMPIIKESLDGIYYDNVLDVKGKSVCGYFFKINTDKYLAFDGKEIYTFDSFIPRAVNKNLAFLLIGGSLFYFDLNLEANATNSVRKVGIDSPSVNKNFYIAKEDLNYSTVRNLFRTSTALFAISQDKRALYYTTPEIFPKFSTIDWSGKTIKDAVTNTDYVICLLSDNSIRYGNNTIAEWESITDLPTIKSLFVSDNVPYIQGEEGLSSIIIQANGATIAEEEHYDFYNRIVKTYFNDNIRFENKAILWNFEASGENRFLVKQKCFDFSNDYQSLLTAEDGQTFLDIKQIPRKQMIAVLSKTKIYLIDLVSRQSFSQNLPNSIGSIDSFGSIYFKTDENNEDICYILHDSALDKFKYQIVDNALQLTSMYSVSDFLSENISNAKLQYYKNYSPIIVSEKSLDEIATDGVNIAVIQEFETHTDIQQLTKDFAFNDLYLNSRDKLFKLVANQGSYTIIGSHESTNAFDQIKGISTADDSNIVVWKRMSQANEVQTTTLKSDFSSNPTTSSYPIFGGPSTYTSIFNNSEPSITTSSGLFRLTSITTTSFQKDENDDFANSVNGLLDAYPKIEFNRLDILKLANEIKAAVSYIESTENKVPHVFTYNISIGDFNADHYIVGAIRCLTFIDGRYLFASDGNTALVYNDYLKKSFRVSVSQLQTINQYYNKILLAKESNGRPTIAYGSSLMSFDGFSDIRIFTEPTSEYSIMKNNLRDGCTVLRVLNEVPDFLVGTKNGAKYIYNKKITMPFFDSRNDLQIDGRVTDIEKIFYKAGDNHYLIAQNNQLFESDSLNPLEFKLLFQFDDNTTILDVYAVQQNEYLIATNVGVYLTYLRYCFVDDMRRFTVQSVYSIINEELRKVLDRHINEAHQPESIVSKVNEKADNKLSFISPESKVEEEFDNTLYNSLRVVKNDIIDNIERGGETDDEESTHVKVGFKNWATSRIDTDSTYTSNGFVNGFTDPTSGKHFDVSTVPYIVKNYKSGIREIYVYVPSTATYYMNNPRGVSNSEYSYMSLSRVNINGPQIANALDSSCTTLRVYLYNSHFRIKTILAAQCFGNSLPLKIYKDNVNEDDDWKGFFDTVIQPSALRTLPMTSGKGVNNAEVCTDDLGRIYLDFSIYGTDAQAIRIIAETEL